MITATSNWVNVYRPWATPGNKELELEKLEPSDLDKTLQHFFAEIKRQNGKDYEPSSLAVMQAAID